MKFINATLYGDTLIQLANAQLTEGTLSSIEISVYFWMKIFFSGENTYYESLLFAVWLPTVEFQERLSSI